MLHESYIATCYCRFKNLRIYDYGWLSSASTGSAINGEGVTDRQTYRQRDRDTEPSERIEKEKQIRRNRWERERENR